MFSTLKKKWHEIPVASESYIGNNIVSQGAARAFTEDLVSYSDEELVKFWKSQVTHDTFTSFYASTFRGKRVLDIGSGMARQTLQFAWNGANVTYCDVVSTNLEVIRRIAEYSGFGNRVQTILIEDLGLLRRNYREGQPTQYSSH